MTRPDPERLAETLAELIARPSPFPPGDCSAIAAYLAERLRAAGYRVETYARQPGVDNVVARLGEGAPVLVYSTHIDTIGVSSPEAWASDPFVARRDGNRLYGLGAVNAKGSAAAQLWLAEEFARAGGPANGTLVFAFVGDEERLGPDGLSYLRDIDAVHPEILVLGGPSANQLITAERGVLWARVTAQGRTAHAGDPSAGDSAIKRMHRLITALERDLAPRLAARHDGPMQSTMNIGRIGGGHNTNAVPEQCWIEVDRRLLPDETVEGAFEEIRDCVTRSGEPADLVKVEHLTGTVGFKGRADGAGVSAFRAAIETVTGAPMRELTALGVSDGRYFARDGIEILNFGPGDGALGHAANEWIDVSDLAAGAEILWRATAALLGVKGR
ncbi:MAG: M20 family metallopeptidase [Alphaproteobacteria bacterium]|nr:M20 family metallopeptidase [Alphaproteobacteria bacterium]